MFHFKELLPSLQLCKEGTAHQGTQTTSNGSRTWPSSSDTAPIPQMFSAVEKLWITAFPSPNIVHFTWFTTHFLHYNLHLGKRGWKKEKCLAYEWAPIKCIKNRVWALDFLSNGQPKSSFSLKLSSSSRPPFQIAQAIIYLLPQPAHPLAPQVPAVPSLSPSGVVF